MTLADQFRSAAGAQPRAEMPQAVNRGPQQWSPQMGLTPEIKSYIDAQVAQGKVGQGNIIPLNGQWSAIAVPPSPGGWVSEVDQSTGETKNVYKEPFAGAYTVIENGTDKNAWHPGIKAYEFNASTGGLNREFTWQNPDRYTMGEKLAIGLVGGIAGGAALTGMGVLGGGAAGGAGAGGAGGGAAAAGGTGAAEAASAAAAEAAATGGAVDLGGGLMMAADGSIIGGTGAFVPATAAEMAAMTGGGLGMGSGAMGAAGAAGEFAPGMENLPAHELTHSMGGLADFGDGVLVPSSMGGSGLTLSDAATAAGAGTKVLGGAGGADPGAFDWSKLIGPGLAAVGGIAGAEAANKAAETQLQASRESNALLEKMFNKQIELSEPFRTAGVQATNKMQQLLGLAGDPNAPDYGSEAGKFSEPEPVFEKFTKEAPQWRDFTANDMVLDPGYQFRKDEGQKSLTSQYAGKGSFLSGAAMKAAQRYGQDYASGEFGKAYDRYQQGYGNRVTDFNNEYTRFTGERAAGQDAYNGRFNRFYLGRSNRLNPYQSMAGMGQTSAGTMSGAAGQFGVNAANNINAGGQAKAAGTVGGTNALMGALGTGYSMYQNSVQTDQNNALMRAILKSKGIEL